MPLYAPDGSLNVTYNGNTNLGLYAPDGSYRVTVSNSIPTIPVHPTYVSGCWYQPRSGTTGAGAAPTANTLRLVPFQIFNTVTITDLGCRVATADATGGVLAGLAIYASAPNTNVTFLNYLDPTGNPLAQVTGLSVAASANVSATLASPVTLSPGLYWMAVLTSSASAVFVAPATTECFTGWLTGTFTLSNIQSANATASLGRSIAATYPTWPDCTGLAGSFTTSNLFCSVFFKVQ